MSVAAQKAVFSLAPQAAKIGLDGTFTYGDYDWYRLKANTISGFEAQVQDVLPPETGGPLVPSGPFKSMAMVQGSIDFIPRLENTLGYLLYATLGSVSSVADMRYTASGWVSAPGIVGHLFRFNSDHSDIPWMAVRRSIPGRTTGETYGAYGWDCRVENMMLNIPASSLITGSMSFVGRQYKRATDAAEVNAWSYANSLESHKSIAHSGGAGTGEGMRIEGDTPKMSAMSLDITNVLTREAIVGSYWLDDITCVGRAISARATYRWDNPDLLSKLFYGSASGTNWDILPYVAETLASVKALYFEAQSPYNIPGTSEPYAVRIMGNSLGLRLDRGSIDLTAGDLIQFSVGIDLYDATGVGTGEYIEIALDNDIASYTWS